MAVGMMLLVIFAIGTGVAISPCQEGEFFHPRKQICLPCRKCSNIEYEFIKCEGIVNRSCKSCSNGTYLGEDKQCRNCTVCVHGTIFRCNSTMDSFCKKRREKPGHALGQKVIIVVVVAVVLLVVMAAVVYVVRRRRQQGKRGEDAAQHQELTSELKNGDDSPNENDT